MLWPLRLRQLHADVVTEAIHSRKTGHLSSKYRSRRDELNDYCDALRSGLRRAVAKSSSSTIRGNIDDNLKRRSQPFHARISFCFLS